MLSWLEFAGLGIWGAVMWAITQTARFVSLLASVLLFPLPRTRQPNAFAAAFWFLADTWLFIHCAFYFMPRSQLIIASLLASVHFLLIVTALLVITEENDVWTGYVRCDRAGGRDDRVLQRGKVLKSLPLMIACGAFYMAYAAVALRAWHAGTDFFARPFSEKTTLLTYMATVVAQIPTMEALFKWTGLNESVMEFRGPLGNAVRYGFEFGNVSIVVGAANSYFRQKREVRRLVDALGAGTGNVSVLQDQAARAPEEIKSAIIEMALKDTNARVRWRAMTVAGPANIVTFPTTIAYHLHQEPDERNKQHALAVSLAIIRRNYQSLQPNYLAALADKINFQLDRKRRRHGEKTIDMLIELRKLTQKTITA